MANIRHLDDPSNSSSILLTLPQSDFPPKPKSTSSPSHNNDSDDPLILVSLHGVTMNDLACGRVYILGDTSEDSLDNYPVKRPADEDETDRGNIHDPIAARLIVEREGKTMDLTRVETSNTYIVVPPMPVDDPFETDCGSNKRRKLTSDLTMSARSVGLVPGEDSPACFFLEPQTLKPGHYSEKLRGALYRWVYDPLDPPLGNFGCTVDELAHICRTSSLEIDYALRNRCFGAQDALEIGSFATEVETRRYGILSEEGRQTVSVAILSALLESDVELKWYSTDTFETGMNLALLMAEIRTQWQNLEGLGVDRQHTRPPVRTDSRHGSANHSSSERFTPTQLTKMTCQSPNFRMPERVIWHCLRSMVHCSDVESKDFIPDTIRLLPDEVAKLAAHTVFLCSAGPDPWNETKFMDTWANRTPSPSGYELHTDLLRGIALSEPAADEANQRVWLYLPEAGLPQSPLARTKAMFSVRSEWTLQEAMVYLEKFADGDGELGVRSILEDVAHAVSSTERGEDGEEEVVTKYEILSK